MKIFTNKKEYDEFASSIKEFNPFVDQINVNDKTYYIVFEYMHGAYDDCKKENPMYCYACTYYSMCIDYWDMKVDWGEISCHSNDCSKCKIQCGNRSFTDEQLILKKKIDKEKYYFKNREEIEEYIIKNLNVN